MTVTVKNKTPLVVPDQIRRRAGFKSGDELEFKVSAGGVTIHPKPAVARDDYTLAERAPSTAASPRAKRSTARVAPAGLSTPTTRLSPRCIGNPPSCAPGKPSARRDEGHLDFTPYFLRSHNKAC